VRQRWRQQSKPRWGREVGENIFALALYSREDKGATRSMWAEAGQRLLRLDDIFGLVVTSVAAH
jgi:hypothetical protein